MSSGGRVQLCSSAATSSASSSLPQSPIDDNASPSTTVSTTGTVTSSSSSQRANKSVKKSPDGSSKHQPTGKTSTGKTTGKSSPSSSSSSSAAAVKCVFVGDRAVGQDQSDSVVHDERLSHRICSDRFRHLFVLVTIDSKPCQIQLCDTAGQADFDSIRPLCYGRTDVFLLCFSVVSPESFAALHRKWAPEIRRHCGSGTVPPIILVGTQCDLRHDVRVLIELDGLGETPISTRMGRAAATALGAVAYIECSALTQKNLKDVFDSAILTGLKYRARSRYKAQPAKGSPKLSVPAASHGNKVSDARLLGWRKSLTKISAQEALEAECAALSYGTSSDSSSSSSCSASSASTSPRPGNYDTMVRHSPPVWSTPPPPSAPQHTPYHQYSSHIPPNHPLYHQHHHQSDSRPTQTSQLLHHHHPHHPNQHYQQFQQVSSQHYPPQHYHYQQKQSQSYQSSSQNLPTHRQQLAQHPSHQASYLHRPVYGNVPSQPPPSPPYHDPYIPPTHQQSTKSPAATYLPETASKPRRSWAKMSSALSIFNFVKNSSSDSSRGSAEPTEKCSLFPDSDPSTNVANVRQKTNLQTTLRSSSFFFLASNNYRKNIQELPGSSSGKKCQEPVSDKDNDCPVVTSKLSSSSSHVTHYSPVVDSPENGSDSLLHHHHHLHCDSSLPSRASQIFRLMSNSVSELRSRKSLLKKLSFSSYTSSSASSSEMTSTNSSGLTKAERSKLKAKKLQAFADDEDDYEEIDFDTASCSSNPAGNRKRNNGRHIKCLLSCCVPFAK